jgi:hypothetical protein
MRKHSSALLLISTSLILESCDLTKNSANDWQNVIPAAANECPNITGTYSIMDEAAYLMLGGQYEKDPKPWDTLNISGNPQQELQITLYESNTGATNETPIKRVRGKDYECQNGFLETEWPSFDVPLNRLNDAIPNDDQFEKSLSFAKNKMGELVIRTNTRHWKGFTVWCGDGCKDVPIPFTSRTRYKWSRWPIATIPAPTPNENTNTGATNGYSTANDGTPEARARHALRKMTKPGAKLVRLTNNGKTWKATFHGDTNSLLVLHEAAQSSSEIQFHDVKMNSAPSTQKELQIEFRLPPTTEEREAKKAAEKNRLRAASLHEAAERALVMRLLPSIPKGLIITASHHDAETFLVEVRHKNEDVFYELITRAIASGEFSQAEIKARKYVDNTGKQVVDILLTPKPQEQTNSVQAQ